MRPCECPIAAVASIVGRKWIIILLRDLFTGKTQFNEFLKANPELSNKVLSQKLKEMEDAKLIVKHVTKRPLQVNYKLTKEGERLKPVLKSVVEFGKSYCSSDANYDALLKKLV